MIDNIELYETVVSTYPEIIYKLIQGTEKKDMVFDSYDSFIDNTVKYLINLNSEHLDFFKNAFKKMYKNKLIYLNKDETKEKIITIIYINKMNNVSMLGHRKFVDAGKYSSKKGTYIVRSECMCMP